MTVSMMRPRRSTSRGGRGAVAVALALTAGACGASALEGSAGAPAPFSRPGPEGVPIPDAPTLALPASANYGPPVDGIRCETNERAVYHIHAHLTVFVDGRARQVPLGIGIRPPYQFGSNGAGVWVSGGSCFYWLHTHTADGVVHVESPTRQTYDLGRFFAVWGQPLSPGQVGPATGAVTAYVNGLPFGGDPRGIVLAAHADIQLDVGTVVPPQTIDWSSTGL